jgi:hypothetical protein
VFFPIIAATIFASASAKVTWIAAAAYRMGIVRNTTLQDVNE